MAAIHGSSLALLICLIWSLAPAGCRPGGEEAVVEVPTSDSGTSADSQTRNPSTAVRPRGVLPTFRTLAADSGLAFERFDDISAQRRIVEANGGGVALFDFDRDGRLDVFFTNGCHIAQRNDDRSSPGQFYGNRGDLQFERISVESRLLQHGYGHGCAVGDYDSDGFDDLYVTAFGPNSLWRNNGDGTFSDVTDATGTHVSQWSSSAAFADLNSDGHLDLYVVNYLQESERSPTLCPNPASPDGYVSCPPAMFEGVDDVLYLSDGAGGFVDATESAGVAGRHGKGLGVVICDLGGDRRPEIYVANDGEPNFLFAAESHAGESLRYAEVALASGAALSEAGYAQAGMGITTGDSDADGTLDLFLTHFYDDTNTLYANRGGLAFEDVTRGSRLGAPSRRTLGWGTSFVDADNDGWLDLIVANGHVEDRTWMSKGEPWRMRPQMFRNERNGTFVDVSNWSGDYFQREWLGRGLAVGDLDRDGRIDAAISHQLAPSALLRNETETAGVSLLLHLVGRESNRNGYGARVEVVGSDPLVVRELAGGGSYQSASGPEVHVGLAERQHATIRIHWPSGHSETHEGVSAGEWTCAERGRLLPCWAAGRE